MRHQNGRTSFARRSKSHVFKSMCYNKHTHHFDAWSYVHSLGSELFLESTFFMLVSPYDLWKAWYWKPWIEPFTRPWSVFVVHLGFKLWVDYLLNVPSQPGGSVLQACVRRISAIPSWAFAPRDRQLFELNFNSWVMLYTLNTPRPWQRIEKAMENENDSDANCNWYYLPTPPLGQDMTQGQFLSGV